MPDTRGPIDGTPNARADTSIPDSSKAQGDTAPTVVLADAAVSLTDDALVPADVVTADAPGASPDAKLDRALRDPDSSASVDTFIAADEVGPAVVPLMIDDFEDGDGASLMGTNWFANADRPNGGLSTYSFAGATGSSIVMGGEGYLSKRSLEINFSLKQGPDPLVGPYISFAVAIPEWAKVHQYQGISFAFKGPSCRVQLQTSDVTDYAYHEVEIPEAKAWKRVEIPFSVFSQHPWNANAQRIPLNLAHVTGVGFFEKGANDFSGTINIDDLALASTINRVADQAINPAAPPAESPLASGTITNPLQVQAMDTLNKGYNITSWLEVAKPDNFDTYNEGYIAKLQAAGFRALRLPIDLGLYVTATSGTGSALEVEVAPLLWTVLDNFEQWTAAHGLSLTIDYHKSIEAIEANGTTDGLQEKVVLWGKIAGHFASNPRKDLYFELLNEPGPNITNTQWTELATNMISAIRAKDTRHTILFGDTTWYNIEQLAQRTPFADTNIIYVFHDYSPMLFTHQGADWTGMGGTHDVPYPYSTARWSAYSMDLGFGPSMPDWCLAEAADYYKNGNRAAIRNHMVIAKNWAIAHNVPVICNEFGVNFSTSRVEDRVNYYADLASIFKELQIPWQEWFTLMDPKTGQVDAQVKAALGL